jgi:ATP-dependent RNA helicase DHX8/PRP22
MNTNHQQEFYESYVPAPTTCIGQQVEFARNLQTSTNAACNESKADIERCSCTVIVYPGELDANETFAKIQIIANGKVQFEVKEIQAKEIHLKVVSRSQGQKLIQLIRRVYRTVALRLEHESHDQVASEDIRKIIETLHQQADEPTAAHSAKIQDVKQQLIDENKFHGVEDFEALSSLHEAKQAKLEELLSQQQEFRLTFESCVQKLSTKPSVKKAIEIKQTFNQECARLKSALPIYAKKSEILNTVETNQVCIVLGETGSGKSTQLVQYLYDAGLAGYGKGQIVCTQPRKVAAISLARHVSTEVGCRVGDTVGYRVGNNVQERAITVMKYVTDRVLLNECMRDALLSKYSCIIVDEAHERSLFTDLLLSLLKQLLVRRPELRLIITSASINPDIFVKYFNGCPVLRVSGRLFPIQVFYHEQQPPPSLNEKTEDFVAAAVNKAWEVIQTGEQQGGILVFLTSSVDIENACQQLMSYPDAQQLVHCLPLHGRLQADEQQKVFEPAPPGKRKVVFSTNVAETSVTIADITCVIDIGLAKEKQYDAKKGMARLQMCMISRSSAEQRKGRAGRTEPGVCHRLYSEEQFSTMRVNSQPEILCTHLGLAMLMFLEMGITKPQDLDFIESPPREALLSAMATLEEIGAVADGKLTELGQRLAKLGLDPCFGKFLLRAIEEGIGFDGLCTVAVSIATSGVFYRGGTDAEKETSDQHKLRFCHSKGDTLTNLNVFQEWWNIETEKTKAKWCQDNSINFKSMRNAREFINEIRKLLTTELEMKIEEQFSEDAIRDEIIPRLMLECFVANVGRFTGNKRKGYFLLKDTSAMVVHPSSSLCMLGDLPKWVVYEQVLSTSQDFILNVTAVEESDIVKAIEQGTLKCDLAALECRMLSTHVVSYVGNVTARNLIGPKGASIRALEIGVQQAISQTDGETPPLCAVEVVSSEAKLVLSCTEHVVAAAMNVVVERLETTRSELRDVVLERPLMAQTQSVRVILQAGGSVKQVLMPQDYRVLIIERLPEDMSEEELMTIFESISKCKLCRFNAHRARNYGSVTYAEPSEAKRAAALCVEKGLPVKPQSNFYKRQMFSVNISWLRRPAKGIAYVSFASQKSAAEFILFGNGAVVIRNNAAKIRACEEDSLQLMLCNLPVNVTEDDIILALEKTRPQNKVTEVIIPRQECSLPSTEEVNLLKKLDFAVRDAMATLPLQCHVSPVKLHDIKQKTVVGRAFVSFSDINCAVSVAAAIHNSINIGRARIEAHLDVRSSMFIKDSIYHVVKADLDAFLAEHKPELAARNVSVDVKQHPLSGDWQINVRGRKPEHTAGVRQRIAIIVAPHVYETNSRATFQLFCSKTGRDFITRLMQQHGIHIDLDSRYWTINIYGCRVNRDTILASIEQFKTAEVVKEINLRDSGKPRGMLKDLLVHYDFDMEHLREEVGAAACYVDLRRHSIAFSGSVQALTRLEAMLDERASALAQQPVTVFTAKSEQVDI